MNFPVAAFDGSFVSPSRQNGPRRPGDPVRRQAPNQLRVMVAGESGLGKTTFLNNIFRHLNQGQNPMDQGSVVHGQTGGIFGHSKTLKIEEREFDHTTSGGQYYKFFLVDTPGYGDHVNVRKSFQPVVDFIIRGSRRYLAEIKRGNDTPSEDGRTDVCIHFIAAHRCKSIDIEYMKQLSKVVAMIPPVIGKSDSMTVDEMFDFKKAIADSAAKANGLEFFTFSERAWEKCLAALNIADEPIWLGERRPPPYAVISSQVDDPNGNAHAHDPVRRYPWGECHVMRPEHSDNTYLQCLLLEVGFQDMKDKMRKRYEAFKKQEAKPLVTRVGEKNREYRLAIASGKPSTILVVLAVIFAFVAVILAATQVHAVNGNEPSTGLADWRELILKIQQVEGSDRIVTTVDSEEETLDVLMKVLMDNRKIWTFRGGPAGSTIR
ncbi:Sept2, septin GTPase [Ectocarpus siliculosus]|uniref:Sept2, septin GTPase n=1 Tax=Ectocarpus siliculosus TaxID=2880 RepID=D8LDE5_ECTSI|nr:Sept2, septin GTPase [Ectocarpus siliculosus]|eukprot:CBN74010.1 Sept2, septin GTPase [Ectocarpus siliculosus]